MDNMQQNQISLLEEPKTATSELHLNPSVLGSSVKDTKKEVAKLWKKNNREN